MKKVSLILSAALIAAMVINSCGGIGSKGEATKEVTIGNQVWMTENLNVDKFRNGDPIPEAKTNEEWENAGKNGEPAWCYYNNNPDNGERYGKLYNGFAVTDPRGLAPEGWKIPSDEDWSSLIDFLGGERVTGKKMKSTKGWAVNGIGTNESGFSGLPGGRRTSFGDFYGIGEESEWWSSWESWPRGLTYHRDDFHVLLDVKEGGMSVRCLKD